MKILSTILAFYLSISSLFCHQIDITTMSIGDDYQVFTYPCYENKKAYCEKHGYNFHYYTESKDLSKPIPWTKVKIIQELFQDPNIEWVFWTDADSLIMNPDIRLESFIDRRYDMIVASDFNDINTGQFFIRNCKWSRDFLERVYTNEGFIDHGWWEQDSFIDLYYNNKKDRRHIKILSQRCMNSYDPDTFSDKKIAWKSGDFIIHFAGIKGQKLINLILKYSQMTK